jgi:hypothetical protein
MMEVVLLLSDIEAGTYSASDSIHDILNDRVVTDHNDQNDELINKTGTFYESGCFTNKIVQRNRMRKQKCVCQFSNT